MTEGRLAVHPDGHEIHYRSHGGEDGDGREALVLLHGGPGLSSDYLEPLTALASPTRRVVVYDQLGGGRSDRPDDPSLWTIERYADELEAVRAGLGLERMDLYGSSWGGFLALHYALARPWRVRSLVLSNTAASVPQTVAEMQRLRLALPPEAVAAMARCEATGELSDPAYRAALATLNARHIRRSAPYEDARAVAEYEQIVQPLFADVGPPFFALWGPHGWLCTGAIADWDVTGRLDEIACPTLVMCGLHDQLTVACHETLAEGIAGSELAIFGRSSHLPMLEHEAEAYVAAISSFLTRRA